MSEWIISGGSVAVSAIVSINSCMADVCLCPSECSMTILTDTCVYVYLCVCP